MHTVHVASPNASGGFPYAATGVLFSVKDYTAKLNDTQKAILTDFFDKLNLTTDDPTVPLVTYGEVMTQVVDFNDRWVYKGSVTTPPCATYVYWNVMAKVYPISQTHLDLFKK
jgi:carbonic anhydrase